MKKFIVFVMLCFALQTSASAQVKEVIQLALNLEKLAQLKSILTSLKKGYEILSKGYNTVKDLTKGNFNVHKTFLDALMEVSPVVKKYRKVAMIADYQVKLINEQKAALKRFRGSKFLNPEEITYIAGVFDNVTKSSIKNLDELILVITAGKLRMSDDERLAAIDRIFKDVEDKLIFTRDFNVSASMLSLTREREMKDIKGVKILTE
uniref:TerB family tellurite resistance protein n=1 Tax=Pedobacter schmidteae TaxID=2201271 RepID=UPI000EAD293E|nr:TerB family tellurite resistance protein [Pedobacter schmidteae]